MMNRTAVSVNVFVNVMGSKFDPDHTDAIVSFTFDHVPHIERITKTEIRRMISSSDAGIRIKLLCDGMVYDTRAEDQEIIVRQLRMAYNMLH